MGAASSCRPRPAQTKQEREDAEFDKWADEQLAKAEKERRASVRARRKPAAMAEAKSEGGKKRPQMLELPFSPTTARSCEGLPSPKENALSPVSRPSSLAEARSEETRQRRHERKIAKQQQQKKKKKKKPAVGGGGSATETAGATRDALMTDYKATFRRGTASAREQDRSQPLSPVNSSVRSPSPMKTKRAPRRRRASVKENLAMIENAPMIRAEESRSLLSQAMVMAAQSAAGAGGVEKPTSSGGAALSNSGPRGT